MQVTSFFFCTFAIAQVAPLLLPAFNACPAFAFHGICVVFVFLLTFWNLSLERCAYFLHLWLARQTEAFLGYAHFLAELGGIPELFRVVFEPKISRPFSIL